MSKRSWPCQTDKLSLSDAEIVAALRDDVLKPGRHTQNERLEVGQLQSRPQLKSNQL